MKPIVAFDCLMFIPMQAMVVTEKTTYVEDPSSSIVNQHQYATCNVEIEEHEALDGDKDTNHCLPTILSIDVAETFATEIAIPVVEEHCALNHSGAEHIYNIRDDHHMYRQRYDGIWIILEKGISDLNSITLETLETNLLLQFLPKMSVMLNLKEYLVNENNMCTKYFVEQTLQGVHHSDSIGNSEIIEDINFAENVIATAAHEINLALRPNTEAFIHESFKSEFLNNSKIENSYVIRQDNTIYTQCYDSTWMHQHCSGSNGAYCSMEILDKSLILYYLSSFVHKASEIVPGVCLSELTMSDEILKSGSQTYFVKHNDLQLNNVADLGYAELPDSLVEDDIGYELLCLESNCLNLNEEICLPEVSRSDFKLEFCNAIEMEQNSEDIDNQAVENLLKETLKNGKTSQIFQCEDLIVAEYVPKNGLETVCRESVKREILNYEFIPDYYEEDSADESADVCSLNNKTNEGIINISISDGIPYISMNPSLDAQLSFRYNDHNSPSLSVSMTDLSTFVENKKLRINYSMSDLQTPNHLGIINNRHSVSSTPNLTTNNTLSVNERQGDREGQQLDDTANSFSITILNHSPRELDGNGAMAGGIQHLNNSPELTFDKTDSNQLQRPRHLPVTSPYSFNPQVNEVDTTYGQHLVSDKKTVSWGDVRGLSLEMGPTKAQSRMQQFEVSVRPIMKRMQHGSNNDVESKDNQAVCRDRELSVSCSDLSNLSISTIDNDNMQRSNIPEQVANMATKSNPMSKSIIIVDGSIDDTADFRNQTSSSPRTEKKEQSFVGDHNALRNSNQGTQTSMVDHSLRTDVVDIQTSSSKAVQVAIPPDTVDSKAEDCDDDKSQWNTVQQYLEYMEDLFILEQEHANIVEAISSSFSNCSSDNIRGTTSSISSKSNRTKSYLDEHRSRLAGIKIELEQKILELKNHLESLGVPSDIRQRFHDGHKGPFLDGRKGPFREGIRDRDNSRSSSQESMSLPRHGDQSAYSSHETLFSPSYSTRSYEWPSPTDRYGDGPHYPYHSSRPMSQSSYSANRFRLPASRSNRRSGRISPMDRQRHLARLRRSLVSTCSDIANDYADAIAYNLGRNSRSRSRVNRTDSGYLPRFSAICPADDYSMNTSAYGRENCVDNDDAFVDANVLLEEFRRARENSNAEITSAYRTLNAHSGSSTSSHPRISRNTGVIHSTSSYKSLNDKIDREIASLASKYASHQDVFGDYDAKSLKSKTNKDDDWKKYKTENVRLKREERKREILDRQSKSRYGPYFL